MASADPLLGAQRDLGICTAPHTPASGLPTQHWRKSRKLFLLSISLGNHLSSSQRTYSSPRHFPAGKHGRQLDSWHEVVKCVGPKHTFVCSTGQPTAIGCCKPGEEHYNSMEVTKATKFPSSRGGEARLQPRPLLRSAGAANAATRAEEKKPRKRAHYLRHSQRCTIIQRIEAGEQQAGLAREYKVTRAAISHIFKNREEILAREFEDKSEEEEEDETEYYIVSSMVSEICDQVVVVLMTTLRDAKASSRAFHRAANRLITILLEESVALLGTRAVERVGAAGAVYTGLERQHAFCGVTLNAEALPFAVHFTELEPNSPIGSIEAEEVFDGFGNPVRWRIRHVDVPANIIDYKILLFTFLCGDTGAECKAIETLCTLGINEREIAIVAVQSSSRGVAMIANHYPQSRIITAVTDESGAGVYEVFPGLGAFVTHHHTAKSTTWDEEETGMR